MVTALALGQPQVSTGHMFYTWRPAWAPGQQKEAVQARPQTGLFLGSFSSTLISWEPVHFPEAQHDMKGQTALGLHKVREGGKISPCYLVPIWMFQNEGWLLPQLEKQHMAPSPEARKPCWVEGGGTYLQVLYPLLLAQEVTIGSFGRLARGLCKVFSELLGELADDLLLGLVLIHEQLHLLLQCLHLLLPKASLMHQALATLL